MEEKDLSRLSYQQLEEEVKNVLKALKDEELALDDASRLYDYGKAITKAMETRLNDLKTKVRDTVDKA